MSIKRKYDKVSLGGAKLLRKGLLKNHVTPTGFGSDLDFAFYNHVTPRGLVSVSDFTFYNHITPMGLNEDFYALYHHFKSLGLLKSRRDDMFIEQLFNKQLNPEGVTF